MVSAFARFFHRNTNLFIIFLTGRALILIEQFQIAAFLRFWGALIARDRIFSIAVIMINLEADFARFMATGLTRISGYRPREMLLAGKITFGFADKALFTPIGFHRWHAFFTAITPARIAIFDT